MHDEELSAVYIMASRYRGTIYTGVTRGFWQLVCDHIVERFEGFSKDYGTKLLVRYEHHHAMEDAIRGEK